MALLCERIDQLVVGAHLVGRANQVQRVIKKIAARSKLSSHSQVEQELLHWLSEDLGREMSDEIEAAIELHERGELISALVDPESESEILQQWEGVVTEVTGISFVATLKSMMSGDNGKQVVEILKDKVSANHRPLIERGAVFYLTATAKTTYQEIEEFASIDFTGTTVLSDFQQKPELRGDASVTPTHELTESQVERIVKAVENSRRGPGDGSEDADLRVEDSQHTPVMYDGEEVGYSYDLPGHIQQGIDDIAKPKPPVGFPVEFARQVANTTRLMNELHAAEHEWNAKCPWCREQIVVLTLVNGDTVCRGCYERGEETYASPDAHPCDEISRATYLSERAATALLFRRAAVAGLVGMIGIAIVLLVNVWMEFAK